MDDDYLGPFDRFINKTGELDEDDREFLNYSTDSDHIDPCIEARYASIITASVPYIDIRIHGNIVKTLCDSGASYSIISSSLIRKLLGESWQRQLNVRGYLPRFELADGSFSSALGKITLPMEMQQNKIVQQRFYILDTQSDQSILGVDFFIRSGAVLDFAKMTIRFQKLNRVKNKSFQIATEVPTLRGAVSPVYLSQAITLQPGEEVTTTCFLAATDPVCQHERQYLRPTGIIDRGGKGTQLPHITATCVTRFGGEQHLAAMRIANLDTSPSRLEAGAVVGYFTPHSIITTDEKDATDYVPKDEVVNVLRTFDLSTFRGSDIKGSPSAEEDKEGKEDVHTTCNHDKRPFAAECTVCGYKMIGTPGEDVSGTSQGQVLDTSDRRESSTSPQRTPNPTAQTQQPAVAFSAQLDDYKVDPESQHFEDGIPKVLWPELKACEARLNRSDYENLLALLREFPDIFYHKGETLSTVKGVQARIHIPPGTIPTAVRQRRLNPHQRNIIIEYVKKMHQEDIIEPVVNSGGWNNALLLIRKGDGTWRACLDLRKVNSLTQPIVSSLPVMQDCLDAMSGSKVFTIVDCAQCFFQMELHPDDRNYTSFYAPIGNSQWRFKRAVMGAVNSQQAWINFANNMLGKLNWKSTVAYADDLATFSPDQATHLVHLRELFTKLREHKCVISAKKMQLARTEVCYVGLIVNEHGISTDPKSREAIRNLPLPRTLKELRRWLGLTGWWRRFIRNYARIVEPLRPLLQKGGFTKKFTDKQIKAFEKLRAACLKQPVLAHPQWDRGFTILSDGSPYGIGACLTQKTTKENSWQLHTSARASPPHKRLTANVRSRPWLCSVLSKSGTHILPVPASQPSLMPRPSNTS